MVKNEKFYFLYTGKLIVPLYSGCIYAFLWVIYDLEIHVLTLTHLKKQWKSGKNRENSGFWNAII